MRLENLLKKFLVHHLFFNLIVPGLNFSKMIQFNVLQRLETWVHLRLNWLPSLHAIKLRSHRHSNNFPEIVLINSYTGELCFKIIFLHYIEPLPTFTVATTYFNTILENFTQDLVCIDFSLIY